MMKAAIVTFASIALAAPVAAQHVEFGPRLGLAFSTVSVKSPSGQNNSEENSVTGFAAGGFVRFRPGKLGVQTELNYVRKGSSVVTPSNPSDALDIQLDYLEIPLLLVVPVTGASSASASLYGGPALALEASCHGTLTGHRAIISTATIPTSTSSTGAKSTWARQLVARCASPWAVARSSRT